MADGSARRRRTEHQRARSLIELAVVVVLSVGFYQGAVVLDLFDRLTRWVDPEKHAHAHELLLALPFALVLLAIYAFRRYREAQVEAAAAVAAEQELARTTEEFRSLFDYHPGAVFSIDPDRRYRHLNPAAEALSGYSEQEMLAREFPSLKTDDRDLIVESFERAMQREPQRLEAALVRKDGQRRDVEVTMIPIIVDDDPVGVYVVAGDITDASRMRDELADALYDAERANDAKTLLIANVSHELRTPLTSVIAAVEMLGDTELDDSQDGLVSMISRNGQALRRLVEDLLDLSRLEVGQLAVEHVPFDLCEVLDQSVALAAGKAADKGLALKVDADSTGLPKVLGDPLRLGQVLTNLLDNAVKFTANGEVGLGLTWRRRSTEVATTFRVWDTGIGIAPADQERLFRHFEQADPSSTRRYGGAGLGLSICRQLVQLMRGQVSVDSQVGVGSTFTVQLALRLADDL